MNEIANRFSISELQSILIFLQSGHSIANLIRDIENPANNTINPQYRRKFENMLSRLYNITAAEEQILIEFSNIDEPDLLSRLQHFYLEN